ncbi:glutamine--fructose-6-phosphate transaminase (isomerizing), partial [Candidatus Gracilibacteria bacterium]|nr:glutamine--fructose-6-phosphate transaminase (isomerizing) [Candidatus Gracilibacteria bacterium]
MCGVFGYLGRSGKAAQEVLAGLQRLEYRGYDSAGVCILDHEKHFEIIKSVGRVADLKVKTESYSLGSYHIGIGHTRWATHGGVTEQNCHPHVSQSGRFIVIHNGIIENYRELKDMLIEKGYSFYSETDTEVTVKLFEDLFDGDHLSTMKKMISMIHGAYGLVFLDRDHPDRIFGSKKGSPMVLGFGKEDRFVSSDYRSLIGLIDEYVILEDGDIFLMTPEDYTIMAGGAEISRPHLSIDEDERPAELGNYPHFMLKEIYEQVEVMDNVFRGRINFETYDLHSDTLEDLSKEDIKNITIVASGTSYNAGLMGKYYLEEFASIPVDVIVSAEFKYKKKFISPETLFIFVSQSGETIDALDSMKIVKEQGGNVFGVVNVPGSAIARLAGRGLYIRAGIEVGVASTKAFTAQLGCFIFLALYLGKKRGLDYRKYRELLDGLSGLKSAMEKVLLSSEAIRKVAEKYAKYNNFFFLGRLFELPIAMEGSLKLKELSYIHSETYASGELKHGSIA